MKKVLVLLVLFVAVMSTTLRAETINFTKPTTYEDASVIAPAESALLQSQFEYRVLPSTTWATFGTSASGASSLALPYVTPIGASSSWRGRSRIGSAGPFGGYSPEVSFSRPFPAPAVLSPFTLQ
jgi:hypothetical protein